MLGPKRFRQRVGIANGWRDFGVIVRKGRAGEQRRAFVDLYRQTQTNACRDKGELTSAILEHGRRGADEASGEDFACGWS